ncbi:MAG TPA: hypothetical protein VM847_11210 [Tahibacter sp.]|nr:hypothetical protein [Tahibacter sp.]
MLCRIASTLLAGSLLAATAAAQTPADRIFHSGLEPAFVISGRIGHTTPLAGATVEALAGSYAATTQAAADGRYRVHLELRYLAGDPLVDLVGYGHGARAGEVWAGALGPLSRLQSLGSSSGIDETQEAFAHLGPYSTAVSAALRGYAGFTRISDRGVFESAARASTPNPYLVFGLALIADGHLSLPAGATNTFAAVLAPAPAQALYAAVDALNTATCSTPADSAYCGVALTLPQDPAVVPTATPATGTTYLPYSPYYSVTSTTHESQLAYRLQGGSGSVYFGASQPVPVTVSADGQGRLTLARSDAQPFRSQTFYPTIGGSQVREIYDTMTIVLRPSYGPGGVARHAIGYTARYSYPDNPEIPTRTVPAPPALPTDTAGEALPGVLSAAVPSLANGSFVLSLPEDLGPSVDGIEGRYGYDIHDFGAGSGTTRRRARSFSWSAAGGGQVNLQYGATQATLQFVGEEEPGVWRSVMRLQNASQDVYLVGLLLPAQASGWTPAAPPTSYQSRVNGQLCSTPYGDLDQLASDAVCGPFGWTMQPGGRLDRLDATGWGSWSYASAPASGGLLFASNSGSQRRGWERVRYAQGRGYVLENFVTGSPAPAITFGPTSRLVRIRDN